MTYPTHVCIPSAPLTASSTSRRCAGVGCGCGTFLKGEGVADDPGRVLVADEDDDGPDWGDDADRRWDELKDERAGGL